MSDNLPTQANICRLCGTRPDKLTAIKPNHAQRIKILFHLHIYTYNIEDDKLSKNICDNCLSSVSSCWAFYLQIHKVQQMLSESTLKDDPISDCDKSSSDDDDSSIDDEASLDENDQTRKVQMEVWPKALPVVYNRKSNSTVRKIRAKKWWYDYPWTCGACAVQFADILQYKQHPCYEKEKRYFCADCSKSVKKYNQLIEHVKKHHFDRFKSHLLLQCDICQLWFKSIGDQEVHRKQSHAEAPPRIEPQILTYFPKNTFKCDKCAKTFNSRPCLKQHLNVHSAEKRYICDVCAQGFRHMVGLEYHKKRHHSNADEQLYCDQCGKIFPTKQSIAVHMLTHSIERPFVCDICQKSFKTVVAMDMHRRRHTDARTFVCDICQNSFRTVNNLRAHMRVHRSDRMHKCSYCGQVFKSKQCLIYHERLHTGEQPYNCDFCQRKFTTIGNRLKHMRLIHNTCVMEKDSDNAEEGVRENMIDENEGSNFYQIQIENVDY